MATGPRRKPRHGSHGTASKLKKTWTHEPLRRSVEGGRLAVPGTGESPARVRTETEGTQVGTLERQGNATVSSFLGKPGDRSSEASGCAWGGVEEV